MGYNAKPASCEIYNSAPLINNLEIKIIFKDKAKKKGVGVIDFINRIV